VVVPTRYRALLGDRSAGRVVVTVDRDQCLLIYPTPEWEQIEQHLMGLPSLHAQSRRLQA
jgi:MraZ protein